MSGLSSGAPVVGRRVATRRVHGQTLEDPYAWLRADNWQEVLRDGGALPAPIRAVLDAENAYSASYFDRWSSVRATLLAEMRARITEDDAAVPLRAGEWMYYSRYRTGGQLPLFCRKRADEDEEIILVDGDIERGGHDYFAFGDIVHSPDHALVAWSADSNGSEYCDIRVRDLATGRDGSDLIPQTSGSIVWMSDAGGFYYVHVDENHRTCKVYRHRLGTERDELVFAEDDPAWFVGISRTESGRYAVITVRGHSASECHLLDLEDPSASPRLIEPRAPDVRYFVTHHGDALFIRTNADGAEDFKIAMALVVRPGRANWIDLVPHRRGRTITGMQVYPRHLVRAEREDGLPRIVIRDLDSAEEYAIAFDEEAYNLSLQARLAFDSETVRFTYDSPTKPRETYDYDLVSGTRTLRKRQVVPSGHDPALYVTSRLFATAPDGARVPITVLHRRDLKRDGTAPLLLYGYGAYGHALPASFSANALSLVDRGFVYALAHVRGGTDKGWQWYIDGKLARKPNTFSDFLVVARRLIADGYTSEGRIIAQGGSAGGMLMGAVANLAPELFGGIIAAVPFVDVLNTMLDADLPLTPPEWLEWGNPINDAEAFTAIRAYSPYDNVSAQLYPPILVLAGLTDPRVTYWEPAKWVARLRATMTGGGPVLLKTNMGAGHGGAAGRFERLAEIAEQYAFALACAEGSILR